ncbi:MAG TPA: cation diffusion facilitator family transporter [Actinomycetota bacterium]|nr:cation diffusion facilitator family transporter [Actinomycetota bacterium]
MSGSHGVAAVAGPEGTKAGLRAIRISAAVLAIAATAQLIVVGFGGSAGLFAAALDNLGDVISTVALAIAFMAARRAADDRYTFGYQRLEDLAGIVVVMVIWASAGLAAYESVRKLAGPHRPTALAIGLVVAGIGTIANEVVARYKMRVGRAIGSQPLIADGRHARIDALASIAAFAGLLGVKLGWRAADPLAGLLITVAIVAIAWDASRHVLARVMDAVDPSIVSMIEHAARETPGVAGVGRIQARWAGRSLYVTLTVAVDGNVPVSDAHGIAEAVHHHIIHDLPGVSQVDVHVDPWEAHAQDAHRATSEHPPIARDEHGHHH